MKKILLLVLAFGLLFSGCEKSYDINERVIVQGVGIDISDSGYLVTVQTLNTSTYSGIGGAKVPESLVKNYYLSGESVADALKKLPLYSGKRPLYTHTRIVLIGNGLAKKGLKNIMDFFTRDSNCHSGLLVAVCEGTAEKTLTFDESKESVPAVEIENIVKNSDSSANAVSVRIYELVKMYREKTTALYLPVISVTDGEDEHKSVRVKATAVFDGDRLYDFISLDETGYLSLLLNKVKSGVCTVREKDFFEASFEFYSSKCKTDVSVDKNGNPVFNIKLRCVFDCVEFTGENDTVPDEKTLKPVENSLERKLSEETENFLNKMCLQGTDCMRLGRVLLIKNPELYKIKVRDWANTLKNAKITVTARATVRRTGQEGGKNSV